MCVVCEFHTFSSLISDGTGKVKHYPDSYCFYTSHYAESSQRLGENKTLPFVCYIIDNESEARSYDSFRVVKSVASSV